MNVVLVDVTAHVHLATQLSLVLLAMECVREYVRIRDVHTCACMYVFEWFQTHDEYGISECDCRFIPGDAAIISAAGYEICTYIYASTDCVLCSIIQTFYLKTSCNFVRDHPL